MRTNAAIFEERGDPWATEDDFAETQVVIEALTPRHRKLVGINNRLATTLARHGIKTAPAKPLQRFSSERLSPGDPEMDQFTKASKAPKRKEMGSVMRPVTNRTPRAKIAQAMMKMHAAMRTQHVIVAPSPPVPQPPPKIGKLAKGQTGWTIWTKTVDGEEEEREFNGDRIARYAFDRSTKKANIAEAELWSNATGLMTARFVASPHRRDTRKVEVPVPAIYSLDELDDDVPF